MGGKHVGKGQWARQAEYAATNLMKQGAPARKLVFQQLNEALSTGSIEARAPIIQQQVEAGLSQGSQAIRAEEEQLARAPSSVARSSFGQGGRAETRATVERAVAQIPAEVIGQTVMSAPETIGQANQSATQLFGVAQQGEALRQAAQAQNYANRMAIIGGIVGSVVNIARMASSYGGGGAGG